MKNFQKFVNYIVLKWRRENKLILEKNGLSGVSNKEAGDEAELFLIDKMQTLLPSYTVVKSKGSFTPADIYAVGRKRGFWHIMLIQVKSTKTTNGIYKLSNREIKIFKELAKFINKEIKTSEYLKEETNTPIIITIGYAGLQKVKTKYIVDDCYPYALYKHKAAIIYNDTVKMYLLNIHKKT